MASEGHEPFGERRGIRVARAGLGSTDTTPRPAGTLKEDGDLEPSAEGVSATGPARLTPSAAW